MLDTEPRLQAAFSDRYRLERELGAGGMATVYLAFDLKHEREVALKILRPELGAVLGSDRFLAEIKITARLDHPHILTLIDSGVADTFFYYVLPYVRGESLRDKLNREKQLGLEESLTITRHIASALDYAHRHGVVHRDIKPENILLQEGEAMLADFGIALAVKEAGGNRLTETGLSLGTPQYMSPEQATGDRTLDARSDVYSLAAVLYEMLAGEPPVTGPSAQAMIAKLMMERPTHLRVVRESVPESIDRAVAKALDKTPADRFATAGDFARALELKPETGAVVVVPARKSPLTIALGVAAVAIIAVLVGLLVTGKLGKSGASFALRDRTQLTFTGNVLASAISRDGKQLAFITKSCTAATCTYAVDIEDVGATATHRIVDGATAANGLEWSPDRRGLLFAGTIKGRYGVYLLSSLGSPPVFLTPGAATFWAGGDSLLIATPPAGGSDSVHRVRVASLNGVVHDSITVLGAGAGIFGLSVTPDGKWIVALILQRGRGLWQVIDRSGRVADKVLNSCTCPGVLSSGALWLTRSGQGFESIVRVALDAGSGRLATRQDTLYAGRFNNFTVTGDGQSMVIDEGTTENSLWAMDVADMMKGRFADTKRFVKTSTPVNAQISPDGKRLLLSRTLPSSTGVSERRISVMPFEGGAESPLSTQGTPRAVQWTDSVTVMVSTQTAAGTHVSLIDVRNGAVTRFVDLTDSIYVSIAPIADGWAWIPASGDRVTIQRGGATKEVKQPAWFGQLRGVASDPAGARLVIIGWNASTFDTLGVAMMPLDGSAPVKWASSFSEAGNAGFLDDGSVVASFWPTAETIALFRVRGPGQIEALGKVPRPVAAVTVSRDLKRATVLQSDYHGDSWMSRVVRP